VANPLSNYFSGFMGAGGTTPAPFQQQGAMSPDQMVQSSLETFLNPNSQYIQQARQQGAQYAQQRGGINSSIAAGASEKEAVATAMPLAQQSLAIQQNRENALTQDWLSNQNFSRELQGQLITTPLNNSLSMMNQLTQYALQDPQLYTPAVMSGFTNFFNQNMDDMLNKYFKG
jgi:hypothetical protein